MKPIFRYAIAAATVLFLSACGGSGSGSQLSTSGSSGSGVAAVGAPISLGTLEAVDVLGRTASTTIGQDGSYSLSFLSELTAPILLRAEGVSGGKTVVHYSVVTDKQAATVNITPVSSAVAAMVMLADPGQVFKDKDLTAIARLTPSSVANANNLLGAQLATAATAVGMSGSSSIDFLNTSFRADKTGLDKILDLVRVALQPDRSVQLKNKTDDGVVSINSFGSVSGALGTINNIDTAGIDQFGQAFQRIFANATQNFANGGSAALLELLAPDLLHEGMNASALVTALARDAADMQGAVFLPAKVRSCKVQGGRQICEALFTVKYTDGAIEVFAIPLAKSPSGPWQLYGDQSETFTEYSAVVTRSVAGNGVATTRSGFNITIYDDAQVSSTDVSTAEIFFSGNVGANDTPMATLRNTRAGGGSGCPGVGPGYLVLSGCNGNFIQLSNQQIDALRATFATTRPKVTVRYKDQNGNRLGDYVITVEALPLKPSEVTDGHFGIITEASWANFPAQLGQTFQLEVNKGPSVGIEDITGVGPAGAGLNAQNLPFTMVRTGNSWNVVRTNSTIYVVTRDAEGRAYWYSRSR